MIRDLTTSAKTPFREEEHLCVWSVQPEFSSSTQRGSSNGHFSWETLPSKDWHSRRNMHLNWMSSQTTGIQKLLKQTGRRCKPDSHKETQACFNILHVTKHKGLPMDVWYRNAGQTHNTNTSRNANKRYHSSLTFSPHAMTSMLRKQWPSYNKLWQCLQLKPFLLQVLIIV
jgi:hypothetical protein